MTNLFRAFDPSSILGLRLNWTSSLLILLFTPSLYFISKRETILFWKKFTRILYLEFATTITLFNKPGSVWFILTIFLFIFVNNVLGLFPYIFTSSRHIRFALRLALPLWLGHICYSWVNQLEFSLAHLVPKNTPGPLMAFMVLIELVRNLIRPLTLRVRLMANLTAGHLLLTLLRANLQPNISPVLLISLTAIVLLIFLEIAVSLIQAYVFVLLSTLYLTEVQTKILII